MPVPTQNVATVARRLYIIVDYIYLLPAIHYAFSVQDPV